MSEQVNQPRYTGKEFTYLDKPVHEGPVLNFFKGVFQETRRVEWPSRDDVRKLTLVVIALTVVMALALGGLDVLLTYILEFFLKLG